MYFGFETGRRIENKKCFNPGVESTIPVLEDKFFESEQSSLDDALTTLSGREFACNSQLAFDQLSHLHAKRLTLDDTAKLTRSIKNASETLSEFPDGVRIEVSTPGLDCSLSEPFQFKKNLNRNIDVVYYDNSLSTKITGKIIRVGDKSFEMESDDKTLSLSYDQVKSAVVNVSFK